MWSSRKRIFQKFILFSRQKEYYKQYVLLNDRDNKTAMMRTERKKKWHIAMIITKITPIQLPIRVSHLPRNSLKTPHSWPRQWRRAWEVPWKLLGKIIIHCTAECTFWQVSPTYLREDIACDLHVAANTARKRPMNYKVQTWLIDSAELGGRRRRGTADRKS